MFKRLMIAGGILNALFFLFHVFVGYRIQHLSQLAANYRALLESFNVAGALFILLLLTLRFFITATSSHPSWDTSCWRLLLCFTCRERQRNSSCLSSTRPYSVRA